MRGVRRSLRISIVGMFAALLCALGAPAPASVAHPAPDANLVAARADAPLLLTRQATPPDVTAVATDPSADHAFTQSTPDGTGHQLVDRWHFYRAAGDGAVALGFLRAHPPSEGRPSTWFSTGDLSAQTYAYPAVPKQLTSRAVEVWTGPAAGGGTAIGIEAKVLWRPTWEQIRLTAHSTATVGLDGRPRRALSRSAARTLARYVDGLGVTAPGVYSCPYSDGSHDTVRFADPRARVWIDQGDCRFASVWIGGRRAPALMAPQLYERIRRLYTGAG
jgi:hypothetical protein